MRAFTTTLAVAAFLVTAVNAKPPPPTGLPSCAYSCVTTLGDCKTLDVKCICSDQSLLASLACCVSKTCDAADQQATIKFADGLCAGQGVHDLPTAATCAASMTGTAASMPSSSMSGSSSMPMTSSSAMAGSMASTSMMASSASAAASATSAAGAYANKKVEGAGVGLMLAGLLAAL